MFTAVVDTDEDTTVQPTSAPIFKKFIGQPVFNLFMWVNNKDSNCKIEEI